MLFNSLQFCLFFAVVTSLYYLLPKLRWQILLVASYLFYMAFIPAYMLVLAATIVLDYYMGLKIAEHTGRRRLLYVQVSILFTCLILLVFKYYNFFAYSVRNLQSLFGLTASAPITNIILPIGLSFHTFQSLSYVIEVYRRHRKPERHFGIYALYVMFYPQLVAGPIERLQNLLPQFHARHQYKLVNIINGFNLMQNFDRPYFSQTISTFWRRWHISLSTWFKDYVYVPLGGNRVSIGRHYVNLMITFAVSGRWPGQVYPTGGELHNGASARQFSAGRGSFEAITALFWFRDRRIDGKDACSSVVRHKGF
jgi:D-alanyl-lipoteichoic acid acyltransferase DltB (MBOAT superfamily)